MPVACPCPEPVQLNDLLHGALTPPDQERLVRHLDTCESCQATLESMAVGSVSVPEVGAAVALPKPPADSAYWRALNDLKSAPSVSAETHSEFSTAEEELSFDFLDPPAAAGELGRLENFQVIEVIGRGGMGVVLKAFDGCLHRFVAIKVLAQQAAASEMARKRFIREVRAAAAIRHENVVGIHTIDEARGGRWYLVMEYVPGLSLEQRLESGGPLELHEILEYGSQLASGLAAAHAQGLIHRDIKPANILLETGVSRVKITDFGLARAIEDGRLTQSGMVVGTPQYMAPEQAQGQTLDHRADLFSLGSVLYAMCTGRPPFEATTTMGILLSVFKDTPRPVQQLNPAVPDWLAEVIAKLHAKNPADRYQSAEEVAELLMQHRCQMHGWRPPQSEATAANVAAGATRSWGSVFSGFLGGLLGRRDAPAVLPAAASPSKLSRTSRASLDGTTGPIWSVAIAPGDQLLAMALDDGTVKLWDTAARRVRATLNAHKGPIWSVAFSPDGSSMATGSDDAIVKLWDPLTGREQGQLQHSTSVRSVAFSPDGRLLVTGTRSGGVHIWDRQTLSEQATSAGHSGVVMAVAFSPDGTSIASASGDKTVKLWDAVSGMEQVALQGHLGGVYAVAFSPDAKYLATGSWDKTVILWDTATGSKLRTLTGHTQDVWSVAFSPDGRTLASTSEDRTVRVWDVASGRELDMYEGHAGTVYSLAYSHDGQTIATGSRDGTVRLWDTGS